MLLGVSKTPLCTRLEKRLEGKAIFASMTEAYYDEGDYRRAKGLFEQLKPLYRGKPQSERITYFYANCLLNTRSYITAAYEFESFTKAFPRSDKLEEAYYLIAYAYAEISPIYSLDQKDTEEALNLSLIHI